MSVLEMDDEENGVKLIQLLAKYNALLEQLQKTFSEGFNNLSRANYYNKDALRGRYGRDYWDQNYEGNLKVEIIGNNFNISSTLNKTAKNDQELDEDKNLQNRKQKTDKSAKKMVLNDPINMFGGALSIPSALRQCQSNFKGFIPLMIQLINCKNDIDMVLQKLE